MGKWLNGCVALCIFVVVIGLCQGQSGYGSRRGPRRGPSFVRRRPCPPVCMRFCPNGNVMDANGCPTCACRGGFGIGIGGGSRIECPIGSRPAFPERSCTTSQIGPLPGMLGMPRLNKCRRGDFCQPSPFDGPGRCCTRMSVKPRPSRPGVCPRNDIITTCQVTIDNCFSDDECSFGEKCCRYGCGRRCLQTVPVKTGY